MHKTTTSALWRNFFFTSCAFLLLFVAEARAQQTFNSGSDGRLGAFNPTQSTEVVLPDDGVLNYTTINIPANITVTFRRNTRNTPVVMLASGDVTIAGTIDVSGGGGLTPSTINAGLSGRTSGGLGGPGGFNGGGGGAQIDRLLNGNSGDGPGGGGGGRISADGQTYSAGGGAGFFTRGVDGSAGPTPGRGGSRYGSLRLLPLIGGSGGGGGSAGSTPVGHLGYGGGGGGGAILIASSGRILFQGNGAVRSEGGSSSNSFGGGGGGAGGGIRLIATTIAGNPRLFVGGGSGVCSGSSCSGGSPGYVRVEAFNYENYAPSIFPNLSIFSAGLPTTVTPANLPQLRITSVAGTNAPATPNGSFFKAPDIILPSSQTSPVTVGVAGTNIPTGTIVKVTVTGETGMPTTVDSTALAGTTAASTATASVTLAPGYNLINATVSVDVQLLADNQRPMYLEGERIKRVEIATSSQGTSTLTFITETGKRIKSE